MPNQMRTEILHTAAYWLLWRVQQAIPKTNALAKAGLTTLRLRCLQGFSMPASNGKAPPNPLAFRLCDAPDLRFWIACHQFSQRSSLRPTVAGAAVPQKPEPKSSTR